MAIVRTLGLLTLVALAACGGSGGQDGDVTDATAAIEQFDPSLRTRAPGLARLNVAAFTNTEEARDAALGTLDAEDRNVRLAAGYTLSLVPEPGDASRLASLVESPDVASRLLAAAAALSLGDARGVPALIEALDDEEMLPVSVSPLRAWELASFALLTFTGEDFGLRAAADVREASATKPAWEQWWARVAKSFEVVRAPDRFLR